MPDNQVTRTQVLQARQEGKLTSSQTVDLLKQVREDPSAAQKQAQQLGLFDSKPPEVEPGTGFVAQTDPDPMFVEPGTGRVAQLTQTQIDEAKQAQEDRRQSAQKTTPDAGATQPTTPKAESKPYEYRSDFTPESLDKAGAEVGLTARSIDIIASTPENLRTLAMQETWDKVKGQLQTTSAPETPQREESGGLFGGLRQRYDELEEIADRIEGKDEPDKPAQATQQRQEDISKVAEKVGVSDALASRLLEQSDRTLTPAQERTKERLQQELGDVPEDRGFTGKVADTLKETFTFGRVETETFNRDDIEQRYEKAKTEIGQSFEEAKAQAEAEGKQVTETKEQYVERVLPEKDEFVQDVLEAQPQLSEVAKEVGLASIPVYGTARTWEESPNWARALGVASDIAFLVPIVGQAAAASRAGAGFARTAGNIAVAELKAPVTALRHPIRTAKTAAEPIETALSPRKIPVEALEVRTHTIRIPVEEGAPRTSHTIKAPTGVVSPEEAMKTREALTQAAIRGEQAKAPLGKVGEVDLTAPALQRATSPAAVTSSPDIRNFLTGITVGEQGGSSLFLAPGRMERFVRATASGLRELPLSEKAEAARRLGQIPDQPVSGSVIIRDPELLQKLRDSGKLYQKGVEIETTLPAGTKIPEPSQVLYTRSAETGERSAVVVIGKPFSPAEIAKLKLIGPSETVKSIFRPGPGRFTPYSDELSKAAGQAKQAESLYEQAQKARVAGNLDEAVRLERQADEVFARADEAFAAANARAGVSNLSADAAAVYTGDQDITGALRTLGEPEAPRVRDDEPETTRATTLEEEPTPEATRIRTDEADGDQVIPLFRDEGRTSGDAEDTRTPPPEGDDRTPPPEGDDRTPPPETDDRVPPPDGDDRTPPPPGDGDREVPPPGERDEPPPPPRDEPPPPPRDEPPPPPRVAVPPTPETKRRRGRLGTPGPEPRPSAQELRQRAPGIAWKQGKMWIALYPPYGEEDILLNPIRQPVNTKKVKGPNQAWDHIRKQGYEIEREVYDEWARWFAPGADREINIDVDAAIPLHLAPDEDGRLPLATRKDFWWSS